MKLLNVANAKFPLSKYHAFNVVKIFILHLKDYNKVKFFTDKVLIYNVNLAITNTGITIGIFENN